MITYRLSADRDSVACDDCNSWSHVHGKKHGNKHTIRHSSRCEKSRVEENAEPILEALLRGEQPQEEAKQESAKPSIKQAAREGNLRSSGYSDDEIVSAVRCGVISESAAMNQDD